MTPRDRIKRNSKLVLLAAVVLWVLVCYLVMLSPRLNKLDQVSSQVDSSTKQLASMRKEIEDARMGGGPPIGGARFDKFGILSFDEEDLFLSDLIDFCKQTDNTLNLLRRSEAARPVSASKPEQNPQASASTQQGQQASGSGKQQQGEPGQPPAPIIQKVPHTVSFSGSFLSSFYLLRRLEAYKRLLTVERVELATDGLRGYPKLNGHITIELYLVKPLPTLPPAASKKQAAANISP